MSKSEIIEEKQFIEAVKEIIPAAERKLIEVIVSVDDPEKALEKLLKPKND